MMTKEQDKQLKKLQFIAEQVARQASQIARDIRTMRDPEYLKQILKAQKQKTLNKYNNQ